MKRYRVFNHTADLGVYFYGPTPADVFRNAGLSLPRLLMDRPPRRGREKRFLEVDGTDREDLLIRWLSELLYIFNVKRLVATDLEDATLEPGLWRAGLVLAPFDLKSHGLKHDMKAATYHDPEFRPVRTGWRARVVFDL
ncbi:MAG: archease [Pseudomonadota bacterium]